MSEIQFLPLWVKRLRENQLMVENTSQNTTNATAAFSNSHACYLQNLYIYIYPVSVFGSSSYKPFISAEVWVLALRRTGDNWFSFFFFT